MSKGVRGPRGPVGGSGTGSGNGAGSRGGSARPPAGEPSAWRQWFEGWSRPLLRRMIAAPRWILVVGTASLLVLGLIQTGDLAWLGGLLLGILTLFLGWLLMLSWPALAPGSRLMRLVVVLALAGFSVLKALGRF